jgi:hypothetical protein
VRLHEPEDGEDFAGELCDYQLITGTDLGIMAKRATHLDVNSECTIRQERYDHETLQWFKTGDEWFAYVVDGEVLVERSAWEAL